LLCALAIALHINVSVVQSHFIDRPRFNGVKPRLSLRRGDRSPRQVSAHAVDVLRKLLRLDDVIDQPPLLCSLTANRHPDL